MMSAAMNVIEVLPVWAERARHPPDRLRDNGDGIEPQAVQKARADWAAEGSPPHTRRGRAQ